MATLVKTPPRKGANPPRTPPRTTVVRRTATPSAPKTATVTPAQLQGSLSNIESQIRGLQGDIGANQQAIAAQAGTLDTLGSAVNGTNGTTAPATSSSGGILSSLTSGGIGTYLVIAGVAVLGYLGYRYYRSRRAA